jgi:hypothetical protein
MQIMLLRTNNNHKLSKIWGCCRHYVIVNNTYTIRTKYVYYDAVGLKIYNSKQTRGINMFNITILWFANTTDIVKSEHFLMNSWFIWITHICSAGLRADAALEQIMFVPPLPLKEIRFKWDRKKKSWFSCIN